MNKISSLTDIVSLRMLERIQDNFSDGIGIGCVIRGLNGETITRFSRPSRLWMEVIKHPEIEKELNENLLGHLEKCQKTGEVQIVKRYMDTNTFIAPMGVDGKVLAFLIGGLTRASNPNIELCSQEAQRLGIDIDSFLEMYLELTFISQERMKACGNLFKIVSSSLSGLAKEGTQAKAKVDEITSVKNLLIKEIEMAATVLKESEMRYKNLFNTINDGVYIAELDGRLKDINPAGARMLGYTREELIGIQLKSIYINPADRDAFMKRILKNEHVENFHPHIRLKDGTAKYFETNATVIKNQQGKIIGVQGIFRDISQRQHIHINRFPGHVSAKTTISGHPHN